MADRSHVGSFDAIESFRAHLVVFLTKARPTVEEVAYEIVRTKAWLENDQRQHWVKEIRTLGRQLEQAQQELFAAKLSKLQNASAFQEMTVQKLRRQLREAEDKQATTKRWARELEDRADPLAKEVESLHSFLTVDIVRAIAYLDDVLSKLQAYVEIKPPGYVGPASSPAAAGADKPPTGGENS